MPNNKKRSPEWHELLPGEKKALGPLLPIPDGGITQIIQDAENMLFTAKMGLDLMASEDPRIVGAGLRISVVFGRHITNALQRLRSFFTDFNDWYNPHVEEMKSDELLKFVYDLRNDILKKTTMPISTRISIIEKSDRKSKTKFTDISRDSFGNPSFHIKPLTGKDIVVVTKDASWDIDLTFTFSDSPTTHLGKKISDQSPENICRLYLNYLDRLVRKAKIQFADGMFLDKKDIESIHKSE